jgi:hypothetical protein
MNRLKRKILLFISSAIALSSLAIFLPAPALANHGTCGQNGSPDSIERCVQNKRDEAYRECYENHEGQNAEIESCVSQARFHYTQSAEPRNIDNLSGTCKDTLFFGIPTWYKYVPKKSQTPCELDIQNINQVLLILLAVVEILTRLGAFLAVGYIIWGGIKFTMSQGEPDGIANARNTIINAVIGLLLTVMATAIITFIGQRIS